MIVHLYGRCAYTDRVGEICRRHGLCLIEDNAQGHGCTFGERRTGALGHAAAHSFYPTKNLGAFGDAGAVTTDDTELADVIRAMGNYGSSRHYIFDYHGRNSRMDEIQAAILLAKLPHLNAVNQRRHEIAARYKREVSNDLVRLRLVDDEITARCPRDYGSSNRDSVHHIFPVFSPRRDQLRKYLADNGVETQIHYPIPPHQQACYKNWHGLCLPVTEQIHAQELSIPCHQAMTEEEVSFVAELLNEFNNN
jgi:dTDP-4-amino-4,6-dideoxygalactose transaminase